MREKSIRLMGHEVRAILDGWKTQTRRLVKLNESGRVKSGARQWHIDAPSAALGARYRPGDVLWARETWHPQRSNKGAAYRATWGDDDEPDEGWKPSIHMPRWACRLLLEVTDVRVERLNDISEEDAKAEGIRPFFAGDDEPDSWGINDPGIGFGGPGNWSFCATPKEAFRRLWESINGPGSWAENPWVWVYQFRKIEHNEFPEVQP